MLVKLTKRAVDAQEPEARDVLLWDTELPGFGCKVTPKGRRTYLLQYTHAGRTRRVTLGQHGIAMTAEQARTEATRLRGLIAGGETPTSVHAKPLSSLTMADLGDRYLEEYAIPHKKPSGIAQDRRNLANHVIPLIGSLLVSTVERSDVARVMRDIATGKTTKDEKTKHQGRRIVRGGEIVANRVQALLSKMFALAEDWKLRPEGSNPCRGVKRYAEHKVERYLSHDEMARLDQALTALELEGTRAPLKPSNPQRPRHANRVKPAPLAALRLLLLTGCRVGEILSLRWKNVDLDRRLLLLADSKTGAKSVFLPEPAIALLRELSGEHAGEEFVFPGEKPGKPIISIRKPWERLCIMARIEAVRLHDLRHNFASVGAANGLSLPVIGALLGHSQPTTTARYAHLAASPLHQAVEAIGAQISAAMGGAHKGKKV